MKDLARLGIGERIVFGRLIGGQAAQHAARHVG
jgi:hypothetical protein